MGARVRRLLAGSGRACTRRRGGDAGALGGRLSGADHQAVAQGGGPRYYPKHLSTLKALSQTAKISKLHHFWTSLVQARRHENHPLANRVQLEALLSQYQQVFES